MINYKNPIHDLLQKLNKAKGSSLKIYLIGYRKKFATLIRYWSLIKLTLNDKKNLA